MTSTRTSTTARTLSRFRAVLLGLGAVVLGVSLTAFFEVRSTVATAAHRTLPALIAVSAAGHALAEADSDAMTSFGTDTVRITGPGGDYQRQITLAGQNLEQAAEVNVAGDDGSRKLLLIDSQLADYRRLIEQAHAAYVDSTGLGLTEAIYASRLMHGSGAVLAELSSLHGLEENALQNELASVWMTPWAVVIWAAPMLGLFVALIIAQEYLRWRFRRRANWWLLAATAALVLVALGTATTLSAEHGLHDARSGVDQLVHDQTLTPRSGSASSNPVSAALNQRCAAENAGCQVTDLAASYQVQIDQATTITSQAAAAADSHGLEFAIPAVGGAIVVLVLVGFRRRLEEYRRRTT
jgi:hypothetical protein